MATYRERREARADRLEEWAEKRTVAAEAALTSNPEMRHDWAFITQPGRIVARERMNAADDRAFASLTKGREMADRAVGIRQQLDASIYSDDPDAIERLTEKLAGLEAKREQRKAANSAYRKEHAAELKVMSAYERSQAVPYAPYEISNLGGQITATRKRLEGLIRDKDRGPVYRTMASRYGGTCDRCGTGFEKGDTIGYCRTADERVLCGDCNATNGG